nr:MAG: hypothetical protein H1Bulk299487_000001 [Mitovirus sp.]
MMSTNIASMLVHRRVLTIDLELTDKISAMGTTHLGRVILR